jgi:hypothetical protein
VKHGRYKNTYQILAKNLNGRHYLGDLA